MKIEKISDSQIKFTLNQADLTGMNIRLEELAAPTEKTQQMFRDMMEKAMEECDFLVDNSPLMVEAVPVSLDSIMIIVTKMTAKKEGAENYVMLTQGKDARRYKRKGIENYNIKDVPSDNISIYSFESLDDIIDLAMRLKGVFNGTNTLYKMSGKYFLLLLNDHTSDNMRTEDIETILNEYGRKHVSSNLSKSYLAEHGEGIIKSAAIQMLAKNFA